MEELSTEIKKLKEAIEFIQINTDICKKCSKGLMKHGYVHPMDCYIKPYTLKYTCQNCNYKISRHFPKDDQFDAEPFDSEIKW
jgi:hypothetical protein